MLAKLRLQRVSRCRDGLVALWEPRTGKLPPARRQETLLQVTPRQFISALLTVAALTALSACVRQGAAEPAPRGCQHRRPSGR